MDSFARLLDTCARALARYENVVGRRPVLAAVSGGADSTAMLLLLDRLARDGRLAGELHVAHVDHGVRGDSRQSARHVQDLCDRLGRPFVVRRLTPPAARPSEDWLRDERYRALAEMARDRDAGLLLTAHHADDNLETVLFRLLRGTGPRGLAGIPDARWLQDEFGHRLLLARPFLRTRKSTLAAILPLLGERAYEDSTNLDLGYARNRLRHETIPALRRSLGLGLDVALMTVASTARAANEIVEAQGLRILAQRARNKTAWRLELDLRDHDPADEPFVREALRQVHVTLHPHGDAPTSAWLDRALLLLDNTPGKRLAGRSGIAVERTRDGLLILDPSRQGAPPRTEDGGQLLRLDHERQRFGATEWWLGAHEHPLPPLVPSPTEAGRLRALLDPRLARLPWRLRTRRTGDRFWPLGAEQDVELRRFLIGRHLPRFDRDRLPLVVDADDRIVWIPGVEISEHARLQLNTRHCIELRAGTG
jgi:tRNA(Ile)-lysidine synthase